MAEVVAVMAREVVVMAREVAEAVAMVGVGRWTGVEGE